MLPPADAPRWVPPPSWPPTPPGWSPPAGWTPPPSWPAAPPEWPFWQDGDGRAVPPPWVATPQRLAPPTTKTVGTGTVVGVIAVALVVLAAAAAALGGSNDRNGSDALQVPGSAPSSTRPAVTSEPTTAATPEGPAAAAAVPTQAPAQTSEAQAPARTTAPPAQPLLQAASGGDGDSWKDTSGREYRLGMVNAPEQGECFGSEATAKRKELLAHGFRADVYTTDSYGRSVAVVTSVDDVNVNVHLARHGFADDRYLARFRHENPGLAAELDAAFAAAKAAKAGLWGACTAAAPAPPPPPPPPPPAPAPPAAAADGCHPDYATCIPIKGDGSGSGDANDLDCPDIKKLVELRRVGVDPYRLDQDKDGWGCETYR